LLSSPSMEGKYSAVSPDLEKSVAKQVNYHWQTLQRSSMANSQKSLDQVQVEDHRIFSLMKSWTILADSMKKSTSWTNLASSKKKSNEESENLHRWRNQRGSTIMEQAEAFNRPRDGIKKQVFNRWSRRASLLTISWSSSEAENKKDKAAMIPKSASAYTYHHDDEIYEFELDLDEGIGLNVSFDSLPFIDDEGEDDIADQFHQATALTEINVPKPLNIATKSLKVSTDTITKASPVQKKKILTKQAKSKEETVQTWKKLSKQIVVAKSIIHEHEKKKKLKKMWKTNYTGMCNRAVVLDKVVSEAGKQGFKVKPVVTSSGVGGDDLDKGGKKNKKYFGLGKKFYRFRGENDNLAINFTALESAHIDNNPGPIGIVALRTATSMFRLNIRTRSVEVLLQAPAKKTRFHETQKRGSLSIALDCNDEIVHESIVASKPPPRPPSLRREILVRKSSIGSCTTEVSKIYSLDDDSDTISSPRSESPDARPLERAVEARSGSEDGLGSMVRCLQFAETFIATCELLIFRTLRKNIETLFLLLLFSCVNIIDIVGRYEYWPDLGLSPHYTWQGGRQAQGGQSDSHAWQGNSAET
jgi:hypothetical protein